MRISDYNVQINGSALSIACLHGLRADYDGVASMLVLESSIIGHL